MAMFFVRKADDYWRKEMGTREPDTEWIVTESRGYWHEALVSEHTDKDEALEAAKESAKDYSELDSLYPDEGKERAIVYLDDPDSETRDDEHIATYEGGRRKR